MIACMAECAHILVLVGNQLRRVDSPPDIVMFKDHNEVDAAAVVSSFIMGMSRLTRCPVGIVCLLLQCCL